MAIQGVTILTVLGMFLWNCPVNGGEVSVIGTSCKNMEKYQKDMEIGMHIYKDAKFGEAGEVSHIAFTAKEAGEFYLGIWRPISKDTYRIKHTVHITVPKAGVHDMWLFLKDRFHVEATDVIGIHHNKPTGDQVKEDEVKSIVPCLQARSRPVQGVKLSKVIRKWNYNNIFDKDTDVTFDNHDGIWTKRMPCIEIHVRQDNDIIFENEIQFRGMEMGVPMMKVNGEAKKVCDARSLSEIAEAWGNKVCQEINENYIMVHAEKLRDPEAASKKEIIENPECPPNGDLAGCKPKMSEEDCAEEHKIELIGCAESFETALQHKVSFLKYDITSY